MWYQVVEGWPAVVLAGFILALVGFFVILTLRRCRGWYVLERLDPPPGMDGPGERWRSIPMSYGLAKHVATRQFPKMNLHIRRATPEEVERAHANVLEGRLMARDVPCDS